MLFFSANEELKFTGHFMILSRNFVFSTNVFSCVCVVIFYLNCKDFVYNTDLLIGVERKKKKKRSVTGSLLHNIVQN